MDPGGDLVPRDMHLDPRWEWEGIYVDGRLIKYVKTQCNHLNLVPVESGGEQVARLCTDCDGQFPPEES